MQLDSVLRGALLGEGEAIVADPAAALPRIAERGRAIGRRRMTVAVAGCVAIAAASWSLTAAPSMRDRDIPPAEERRDPVERQEGPLPEERRRVPAIDGASRRGGATSPAGDRAGSARRPAPGAERPARRARAGAGPADPLPAADKAGGVVDPPRRVSERYDVAYVAGTHVGENGGTGCSQGDESIMRSNDCIAIVVGDDESSISLSLLDDRGVLTGATIYQHAGGEGRELGSFCGETAEPLSVEPGALLLVYVDTSSRCSDDSPGTGTLVAHIR